MICHFFHGEQSTSTSSVFKSRIFLQFCIYCYVLCLSTILAYNSLMGSTAHSSYNMLWKLSAMKSIVFIIVIFVIIIMKSTCSKNYSINFPNLFWIYLWARARLAFKNLDFLKISICSACGYFIHFLWYESPRQSTGVKTSTGRWASKTQDSVTLDG